jgi:hypothetical protein
MVVPTPATMPESQLSPGEALTRMRYGLRGLYGLGQAEPIDQATGIPTEPVLTDPTLWDTIGVDIGTQLGVDISGGVVNTPTGGPVTIPTSTNPVDWTKFYTALIQGGIDIAKLQAIQPGTSQAGGSITRQAPGFPVQPIQTSTKSTANLGLNLSSGGGMAIAAIAAVAIVLVLSGRQRG